MLGRLSWQLVRNYLALHFVSNLFVALGAANILAKGAGDDRLIGGVLLVVAGSCFFIVGAKVGTVADDLKLEKKYNPADAASRVRPGMLNLAIWSGLGVVLVIVGVVVSRRGP